MPERRPGPAPTARPSPCGASPARWTRWRARRRRMAPGPDGLPGGVLGAELARRIGAREGDRLRLVALGFASGRPSYRYQTVRVVGTYRTGFAEFDRNWMVLPRDLVARLSGGTRRDALRDRGGGPGAGPGHRHGGRARARRRLPGHRLAAAQPRALLGAATAAAPALLSVRAHRHGVHLQRRLDADGAGARAAARRRRAGGAGPRPAAPAAVFLAYGASLGLTGTLLGVGLGSGAAWLLDTFELVRFDPEVAAIYFLSAVPFRGAADDLLVAVVGFSLLFTARSPACCRRCAWAGCSPAKRCGTSRTSLNSGPARPSRGRGWGSERGRTKGDFSGGGPLLGSVLTLVLAAAATAALLRRARVMGRRVRAWWSGVEFALARRFGLATREERRFFLLIPVVGIVAGCSASAIEKLMDGCRRCSGEPGSMLELARRLRAGGCWSAPAIGGLPGRPGDLGRPASRSPARAWRCSSSRWCCARAWCRRGRCCSRRIAAVFTVGSGGSLGKEGR